MHPLRVALAACALFAAPAALLAQQGQPGTQSPNAVSNPPVRPPHPRPSGGFAHRPNQRYANGYPIVIDGSVINRLLATPTPAPKHTHAAHPNNGEQVFETHSTTDNR